MAAASGEVAQQFGEQAQLARVRGAGNRPAGQAHFQAVERVRMKNEPVGNGGHTGRESGFRPQIGLGDLMKIAVFYIRPQNQSNGFFIRKPFGIQTSANDRAAQPSSMDGSATSPAKARTTVGS